MKNPNALHLARTWPSVFSALLAGSFTLITPSAALPQGRISNDVASGSSYVRSEAIAVKAEDRREPRARIAIQLAEWVRKNPASVADADIAILADLLREDDDIVRRSAAGALGFLGKRARSTAPQLIQALSERPCASRPALSADAIRLALERIGAGQINIPCTDPFGSP